MCNMVIRTIYIYIYIVNCKLNHVYSKVYYMETSKLNYIYTYTEKYTVYVPQFTI